MIKQKAKKWLDDNVENGFKVPFTFVGLGFLVYLFFLGLFLLLFLVGLNPSPLVSTASPIPSVLNPVTVIVNSSTGTGNSRTLILSLMTATMTFVGGLIGLFYLGVKVQERHEYFNEQGYKTRNDTNNEIISALKLLQESDVTSRLFAVKTLFDIIKFRQNKRTTQDIVDLLTAWLRHEGNLRIKSGMFDEVLTVNSSQIKMNNFEVNTTYQDALKFSKVRENILSELTELLDLKNDKYGDTSHRESLKLYLNKTAFNEDFVIRNAKLNSLIAKDCCFTENGNLSLINIEIDNDVEIVADHVGDYRSSILIQNYQFNHESGKVFIGYKDVPGYKKPDIEVNGDMKSELII